MIGIGMFYGEIGLDCERFLCEYPGYPESSNDRFGYSDLGVSQQDDNKNSLLQILECYKSKIIQTLG